MSEEDTYVETEDSLQCGGPVPQSYSARIRQMATHMSDEDIYRAIEDSAQWGGPPPKSFAARIRQIRIQDMSEEEIELAIRDSAQREWDGPVSTLHGLVAYGDADIHPDFWISVIRSHLNSPNFILDFTLESLAVLDRFLEENRIQITENMALLRAILLYFNHVLCRSTGGKLEIVERTCSLIPPTLDFRIVSGFGTLCDHSSTMVRHLFEDPFGLHASAYTELYFLDCLSYSPEGNLSERDGYRSEIVPMPAQEDE